MAELNSKPSLQKPPGYRDPNTPVAAPPKPPIRKPYIPPSFHPKRKRRSWCRRCCCCFCVLILVGIILIAVAGGIFYLWFEPKLPKFHLQSLKFPQFDVSVKPDGTFLDAKTVVRFQATNPNHKITFSYGKTEVRLTIGDDVDLGSATIPAFTQGKRNTTVLKFGTQLKKTLIDDDVGTKLKARFRNKELMINVEVRTKFGIGVDKLKLGKLAVRVRCEDVSLKKLDGGATPKCTINFLRWINLH